MELGVRYFQVLEDYGHPNHVLLLAHGFSLGRQNGHDCVRIDAQRPRREHPGYWETLARMEEVGKGRGPNLPALSVASLLLCLLSPSPASLAHISLSFCATKEVGTKFLLQLRGALT